MRYFYFKQGNSHSVVRKDLRYETNSVSRYQQKVHTRVIDAKLNQKYSFAVNSTLEYIFQYSYTQDVCMKHVLSKITLQLQIILIDTHFQLLENQALSVQVTSQAAFRENPILVVVRQQKAVLSWQLPLLLETASGWYVTQYGTSLMFLLRHKQYLPLGKSTAA